MKALRFKKCSRKSREPAPIQDDPRTEMGRTRVYFDIKIGGKAAGRIVMEVVGLYFSAGWCPPCRAFTPKLKRFYEKIKKVHPEFEVVFVSRDREEEGLVEYYEEHMGEWTYIPFGNEKIAQLLEKYEVKTIPSMRIIKPDGTVVVQDARTEIQEKGTEPESLWEEWLAFYD